MNMLIYKECTKYLIHIRNNNGCLDSRTVEIARNLILTHREKEILELFNEAFYLESDSDHAQFMSMLTKTCYSYSDIGQFIKDRISDFLDPIVDEIWNGIGFHDSYEDMGSTDFEEQHEVYLELRNS